MVLRIFLIAIIVWHIDTVLAQSIEGEVRQKMGKVTSPVLGEISGIVPSVKYHGCFWVHNDSGDDANIYLIDSTAALLHTVKLEGVEAIDFEEIAWFYDRQGKYKLIVGDIGDNRAVRENIAFHVLEEPIIDKSKSISVLPKDKIVTYCAVYPDGARDAEAFFVDPLTGELVLITKRDFQVHVYTSNLLAKKYADRHILSKKTQLPIQFVTAADISRDGRYILVKNLLQVHLWTRYGDETLVEVFNKPSRLLPYRPEPQGEAIAFGEYRDTFYTISERPLFLDSYLYRYKF